MSEENTSTEFDVSAAGAKIAAMMTGTPEAPPASRKVEAPQSDDGDKELSANADDLGQSESDATENVEGDLGDDADENEQSESDAIVLPKSLKSPEDQKAFRELPPDAQKLFNRLSDTRETEQNKHFDQRMQQLAAERRQIQAHVETVNAERAHREQQLQTLAALTVPQIEELKAINWDHLAHYDQNEYIRLSHIANSITQRAQTIQNELGKVQQEKAAQLSQANEMHRLQQMQVAFDTIPEWSYNVDQQGNVSGLKDEAKAKSLANGISDLLKSHDLADNIGMMWQDARFVKLLREHVLLRQEKAARTGATAKKSTAAAPTFMKPSTPGTNTDSKTRKYKDQKADFKKSNSLEDAGRLIGMMLQ